MKAVILAGGLGTRLSEETSLRPKPMVEIGGKPILWHIMKMYSHYGINEFIICLGYKGYMIKDFFMNYSAHMSDLTVDLSTNETTFHNNRSEPWKVTLVDTGENTMTGGRLKRLAEHLKNEDTFCMTYGDGVCDVNISDLIDAHKKHGKMATLTAVQPAERYGVLEFDDQNKISSFKEKPANTHTYINGGFFVLSNQVLEHIAGDSIMWEREPLEAIAKSENLYAYKHSGFWQCMDTLRDKTLLEDLIRNGKAPWIKWT
ncbi:glucose-1-phosphate cytidylyltransferase [Bdellovibrio bacteriovorus]|uniref:glucose-1-phosphate cytidylyltransferase n=1 Tax=Bdellovibrio bacteriovorus TaxID=959 RepID=UPI0035A58285